MKNAPNLLAASCMPFRVSQVDSGFWLVVFMNPGLGFQGLEL